MNTQPIQLPEKPRPVPSPEHEPWWQALREHRLVAQRCNGCETLRLYPRPMCDRCYSLDYDWVDLSGAGKVHSWCRSHHAFNPAFKQDLPYLTVTVDLKEGPRLQAPLIESGNYKLSIGQPVEVDFEDVDDTYTRLRFKLSQKATA